LETTSLIKCTSCGTFNRNLDYCTSCGALINPELKRKIAVDKRKKAIKERVEKEDLASKNTLFYRLMNHEYFIVRVIAKFFYSIWVIIAAIGSFAAWLAAAISA
jgi:ribosomal protein L37E